VAIIAKQKRASFLKEGALAGVSALAVNASTFAFYIASLRSLGVVAGGTLLSIVAASLMICVPATIGGLAFGTAAARLIRDGNVIELRKLGALVLIIALSYSFAIGIVGILLAPYLAHSLHDISPQTLLYAALLLVASIPLAGLRSVIQGAGALSLLVTSNLIETIGRVGLSAILLLHPQPIDQAILGLAGVLGVATLFSVGGVVRALGVSAGLPHRSRELFVSIAPTLVTMGSLTILTFFDAVATRVFLSPRESGLYNAAALAGRALMTLLAFAPATIMPKVASADPDSEERTKIVLQALTVSLVVCLCASAFFLALPGLVIRLIAGAQFAQAASLVGVYGVAASALALATIIASIELGQGGVRIAYYVAVAAIIEVIAIVVYHPNAVAVVGVVAGCHTLALVAAVVGGSVLRRRATHHA
jgi:O-antigen/teichoic acid export membrane protein